MVNNGARDKDATFWQTLRDSRFELSVVDITNGFPLELHEAD